MWLCGPFLPSGFLTQTSKFRKMTVKFRSNASVTRLGFRATIQAIASSSPDLISYRPEKLKIVGAEKYDNFTAVSNTNATQ